MKQSTQQYQTRITSFVSKKVEPLLSIKIAPTSRVQAALLRLKSNFCNLLKILTKFANLNSLTFYVFLF